MFAAGLGHPHPQLAGKGAPRSWSGLEECLGFKLYWRDF